MNFVRDIVVAHRFFCKHDSVVRNVFSELCATALGGAVVAIAPPQPIAPVGVKEDISRDLAISACDSEAELPISSSLTQLRTVASGRSCLNADRRSSGNIMALYRLLLSKFRCTSDGLAAQMKMAAQIDRVAWSDHLVVSSRAEPALLEERPRQGLREMFQCPTATADGHP